MTVVILLTLMAGAPAPAQESPAAFAGRWDLTVTAPGATYPSWMEVVEKGGSLEVRAQQREGSVRPVAAVQVDGPRLLVTVTEGQGGRPGLSWELTLEGGRLTGVQKRGGKVAGQIVGVRAPALQRAAPKRWSKPEPLFNGKDLAGWVTVNNCQKPTAETNHWTVKDGEMVNLAKGHNIVSVRKFDDFKLHVEFNLEPGANSGIYLRGRYECQMPPPSGTGERGPGYAIYGFVPALTAAPCVTGEWCSYDITLVGRRVTAAVNGTTIVDGQEIPGITGGALDSNEGEPGPIYFQGDHSGGIRYRNITIATPEQ